MIFDPDSLGQTRTVGNSAPPYPPFFCLPFTVSPICRPVPRLLFLFLFLYRIPVQICFFVFVYVYRFLFSTCDLL